MKDVLFLTNIPSPYKVDFFDLLGQKCNLTVLYERHSATNRESNWLKNENIKFRAIFLKGKNVGEEQAFCPGILRYLKKYDTIIISDYSSLTGILAILYLKIKKKKFILHADGGIIKNESIWKKKFKTFLISLASYYFSSGCETTKYFCYYGASVDRIHEYPFTSVSQKNILSTLPNKNDFKRKLDIKEKFVIVSIGQMIPRKGFDILLKVALKTDNRIGYYLIGGEPYQALIEYKEKHHLENVHFIPFVKTEKIYEYLKAAEIFVFLTREDIWGLVINEAMAVGTPIISSKKCNAALEMITDNRNGYLVEGDDIAQIVEKIEILFNSHKIRTAMGNNNLRQAKIFSLENMVEVYFAGIEKYWEIVV